MSNTGHIAKANLAARKPNWRIRRAWRRLLLWLLTPPAAIAMAFQLQPAHVVLDIPVTPHRGVGYFWEEEQASQLSYTDSRGVLYVHRKVGTAHPNAQGWQTAEEAFAHFNSWLTANGWVDAGTDPRGENPAVPESRFLSSPLTSPRYIRRYRRGTDSDIRATVTVWPLGPPSSRYHDSFHVVVTTERPSWARILGKGID